MLGRFYLKWSQSSFLSLICKLADKFYQLRIVNV